MKKQGIHYKGPAQPIGEFQHGFVNLYIANQEELGNIQIAHQVGELVDQDNNLYRVADNPEETANYNLVVGQGVQNLEVDYGQSTIPSEGSLPPNEGFVGQSVVSETILDNAADEYIHRGDVEGLPEPEDLRLEVNLQSILILALSLCIGLLRAGRLLTEKDLGLSLVPDLYNFLILCLTL